MIVQRGFPLPPSFHIDRLRQARGPFLRRHDTGLRRYVFLRADGLSRTIAGPLPRTSARYRRALMAPSPMSRPISVPTGGAEMNDVISNELNVERLQVHLGSNASPSRQA